MSIILPLLLCALGDSAVLLQKGLMELRNGQLTEARNDLQAASQSDPDNGYLWSALAEVYLRTHEAALAEASVARAEIPSVHDPLLSHALALYYSRAGQFLKAAAAERRFAESTKADAAATTRVARWYLAADDTEAAVPFARKAASSSEPAAFDLAQLLLQHQHFSEAARVLQAGLDTFKGDAQLTLAMGVARYGQRRFQEAVERFLEVIRIDPTIEQPYRFLGRMLDQAGPHLDEIISVTQVWAGQHPDNGEASLLLAEALLTRDPEDTRAAGLLRRAAELEPDNWETHYEWGTFLETKHEYDTAAVQLERAVELNSEQPMPHYHLARVYSRLGKNDLAATERSLHQKLVSAGPKVTP